MYSLAELAEALDLVLVGESQRVITGLASLSSAGPSDLGFLSTARERDALKRTRAGAVIISDKHRSDAPCDMLLSASPYLSFAMASALFDDTPHAVPGIHPRAVVAEDAVVHSRASVAAGAVLESGSTVEADCVIGAGVVIGRGSKIGSGTQIHSNAVIYHRVCIGRNCLIHAQSVIGADGFGFARHDSGWQKIRQLGGLRIGDNVEIGAGTTIDRGTLDDTVIEDGVIIDNQVQVGHNCRIGANTAIAGCVGLAGSTKIGKNCTLAGGVGVVGHLEICDNVHVTGMTMVTRSIAESGTYSSGTPMAETSRWKRSAVRFGQLDSAHDRLVKLEQLTRALKEEN